MDKNYIFVLNDEEIADLLLHIRDWTLISKEISNKRSDWEIDGERFTNSDLFSEKWVIRFRIATGLLICERDEIVSIERVQCNGICDWWTPLAKAGIPLAIEHCFFNGNRDGWCHCPEWAEVIINE